MNVVPRNVNGIIHTPFQYLLEISALMLRVEIGVWNTESSAKYYSE